jgi:hypothetical protein
MKKSRSKIRFAEPAGESSDTEDNASDVPVVCSADVHAETHSQHHTAVILLCDSQSAQFESAIPITNREAHKRRNSQSLGGEDECFDDEPVEDDVFHFSRSSSSLDSSSSEPIKVFQNWGFLKGKRVYCSCFRVAYPSSYTVQITPPLDSHLVISEVPFAIGDSSSSEFFSKFFHLIKSPSEESTTADPPSQCIKEFFVTLTTRRQGPYEDQFSVHFLSESSAAMDDSHSTVEDREQNRLVVVVSANVMRKDLGTPALKHGIRFLRLYTRKKGDKHPHDDDDDSSSDAESDWAGFQ